MDAVASASGIPAARIRRAAMLAGDLRRSPGRRSSKAKTALSRFVLQPFQPVQPMLADSADDVGGALAMLGEASFEYKLDGARIQVHKVGDEVRVYSRKLRDVTIAVPEVVTVARAMPAREIVLDGEAIALAAGRHAAAVSDTMRRFGRKLDVERSAELPITPFFFDALYVDGEPLIDEPLTRRIEALRSVCAGELVPRLVTATQTRPRRSRPGRSRPAMKA